MAFRERVTGRAGAAGVVEAGADDAAAGDGGADDDVEASPAEVGDAAGDKGGAGAEVDSSASRRDVSESPAMAVPRGAGEENTSPGAGRAGERGPACPRGDAPCRSIAPSSITGAAACLAGSGDAANVLPVPEIERELLGAGSEGSNKVRLYFLTRSSYNTGSERGKYEGGDAEDGAE
jgi:hypothetical protein